ncbi:MAG: hypothetical protein K8R21_12170, partial [Leptospira sp.]|nr:hypothetical protein [Leptospira sp.]
MKKIIYLNFVLAFGLYAQTNNAIATDAKSTEQTIKEEATIAPPINKPVESKTAEAKPVDPKPDFTLIQFFANDVNFRGTSIYGEKLSRRNQEGYKSFNDAWLVSSNIIFHLPIPGLKFLFTSNNPIENRSNKDADQRFQTSPGADDQTAKLNQAIQTGSFSFDPSAVRSRKEQNGLRDVFIGQMYYDWETKAGGFRTGFFFLNNQNYPAKFNLGEWVFGFRPDVLKFLNPELTMFYRFTSELNGLNNGNIHIRAIIKHEFFKEEFFRVTPILEAGYQAANNNTDRRNGVSDITARLQ